MGNTVKIVGFDQVAKQIEQGLRREMWGSTVKIAEDLTQFLKRNLSEFYENCPKDKTSGEKSKYYSRTGEFANSIYVKPTQGRGKYGLSIRFDQNKIEVHMAPSNSKGKRNGQFNKHADFDGNLIDIDMLVSLEEEKKSILEIIVDWTDDFLKNQGYDYHMSITNYDDFGYEML